MRASLKSIVVCGLAVAGAAGSASRAAVANFTVDPSYAWVGFMNVSELPANGGAYVFGSSWGTADLTAVFTGPTLALGPNCVGDPDPFWYVGGGGPGHAGNKIMDANMYVESTGTLSGETVNFSGIVLSNTLVSGYTSVAFIKDFAPDYSSSVSTTIPLTAGPFSLSLDTINDPNRHVQFGFETIGADVWVTDTGPIGTVQLTASAVVPEPSTLGLAGAASLALLGRRRRA